jgi:hypothetical protein
MNHAIFQKLVIKSLYFILSAIFKEDWKSEREFKSELLTYMVQLENEIKKTGGDLNGS